MRRGQGAWAGGTAITLAFAAWVASSGPSLPFDSSPGQPQRPPGPPVDFEVGQDDSLLSGLHLDELGDSELVQALIALTVQALLALAGALVLLLILLLARNLIGRLRPHPVATMEGIRGELVPDVLRAGVVHSEAELARADSAEAVIHAWLTLEDTARQVGIDDDESRTPAELVGAVLESYDVDRESLERLAAVYREARFSLHPIGESHRETARSALQRIRDDLERPLLATGVGLSSEYR